MRRPLAVLASTLLAVNGAALVVAAPSGAQVPAAQADYRGYSTGSIVHVGALRLGSTQLVDAEVGFSGATVASQGTDGVTFGPGAAAGTVVNEYGQVVQPRLPNTGLDANLRGDRSFGRGSALEVGLANNLPVMANQIILSGKALASALPSTDLIRKEVGPVKLDGLAYASLLRGEAQARFRDDRNCLPGQPLSTGSGNAADVQLLGSGGAANQPFDNSVLALDSSTPERRVAQSRSTTQLVPQVDVNGNKLGDNFGLMTETRQTIAPVTLFRGLPTQLTIEFLGEWVLRSVATGVGGSAGNYVFYGPGKVSLQTPILRILPGLAPALDDIIQITLQQLLGSSGLVIPIPGIAEVAIGEDPRAIGGNAASAPTIATNGTEAAAAVDVVRVTLLNGSVADVRIGHMEARSQVPVGGIRCTLPVTKTADKSVVTAGDRFTYTITVTNPFGDCTLTNVRVVDTIAVPAGVLFSVIGTSPAASVAGNVVTFNDIGPIGPNSSKAATITVAVPANSGPGLFTNTARATGTCATGTGNGAARIDVNLVGDVTVQTPQTGPGFTSVITPPPVVNPALPPGIAITPQAPAPAPAPVPAPAPAPAPQQFVDLNPAPTPPPPSELPKSEPSRPAPVLPRTGGTSQALMAGSLLLLAVLVRRLVTRARC